MEKVPVLRSKNEKRQYRIKNLIKSPGSNFKFLIELIFKFVSEHLNPLKMKTTILVLSLLVVSLIASASKTPPAAVKKTFTEKFKTAEKVKWDMEDAKEWEAEFVINGKEASASFDLSGKWLETEMIITKTDLPAVVKTSLDKEFAGAKIGECSTIDSPDLTGYEIAIVFEGKSYEVKSTREGELTAKEELKEKKDKD